MNEEKLKSVFSSPKAKPHNLLRDIFHFGLATFLIIIRLPCLLFWILTLVIFHNSIVHLIYFDTPRRIIILIVHLIVFRFILLCFGIFEIRGTFELFSTTRKIPKMKSGFMVLCNHTSPLDIFYLSYIMSPQFVKIYYKQIPGSEDIENFFFAPLSFFEGLKIVLSNSYMIPENMSTTKNAHRKISLIKIIEESFDMRLGPALIFFEGGKTNGSGILKIDANFLEHVRTTQIKYHRPTVLLCIDYKGNEFFSPKDPSSNELLHLLKLMGNLKTDIEIRTQTISLEPGNKEEYLNFIKTFYFQNSKDELNLGWSDYRTHLINLKKYPLFDEDNKNK